MTLKKLTEILSCNSAWDGWEDREVSGGFTSDLLSDVMARAEDGDILITIQAHKNTIAVATLKDLAAILVASSRPVPEDMIQAAKEEDIPILVSADNQFDCSWKLHQALSE
ncbi:MAG: hypothetical protein CSA76_04580 [Spirochaetales bacterium]|nr:MAG: hypothetical protein CSA76_04580 [Spirochaetales bacterium]